MSICKQEASGAELSRWELRRRELRRQALRSLSCPHMETQTPACRLVPRISNNDINNNIFHNNIYTVIVTDRAHTSCVKCFAEVITINSKSHSYFTNEEIAQVILRVSWLEFLSVECHWSLC